MAVIFHLAAGRGEKSFPDAFMNSVVTTQNLLEASMQHKCLRRFVNISSLKVYTNMQKPRYRLLDESFHRSIVESTSVPIAGREILLTANIMDSIFAKLYGSQRHCQTHDRMRIIH